LTYKESALLSGLVFAAAFINLEPTYGRPPQSLSICGSDDRRVETFSPVGIVREMNKSDEASYCTLTLVSDSCAVSAGHCLHVFEEAEFFSSATGTESQVSSFKYSVAQGSVRALQSRIGNDWAVMRLMPNHRSGLLPGKVHGFVEVELNSQHETPREIYAFSARKLHENQFEIVSAEGAVLWTQGNTLFHDVDTDRGSSGSLIFDALTNRAVGIHTHGGCDTMKNNKATFISQVPFLVRAIEMCRAEEKLF